MEAEKYYQVALTRVPSIGYVHAKILLEQFGSARAIFEASLRTLQSIEGIGQQRASHIRNFTAFSDCEKLVQQSEAKAIRLIGYNDPDYPSSLKDCYDPPSLLYYAGTGSLNLPRTVAIIGTRNHSEYGRQLTQQLVKELAAHNICIISGMAYGIDGLAHRTALENGGITIGVLAHGLDHIYPSAHTGMAKDMLKYGGALLTEFPIGTKAQRHHFPIRNRIVAGISKAVIIIETGVRGGSVITAGMANSYNIPVFAIPGRLTDKSSAGCNQLVRDQKAILFNKVSDFLDEMQWKDTSGKAGRTVQLDLLPELDPSSTLLVHLLGKHGILPLDQLYILSGLESGTAAKAILDLELGGIIKLLPGKRYALV